METVIKNETEEDFAVLHSDLQVKLEPADRETSAELHELYRGHEIKEEMVVGPVVQKPGPSAELESRGVTPDSSVRKQLSPCGLCGQDMASSSTLTQHKCTHASDTSSCNIEEQGEKIATKFTINTCKDERHCRFQPSGGEDVGQIMRLTKSVVHIPEALVGRSARKRCVVCQRQGKYQSVRTRCTTCGTFLCFKDCWLEWHSLAVLKGHDFHTRKSRKRRRSED